VPRLLRLLDADSSSLQVAAERGEQASAEEAGAAAVRSEAAPVEPAPAEPPLWVANATPAAVARVAAAIATGRVIFE